MKSQALVLSDDWITLRPYTIEDASSLYDAVKESTATVGKWMAWCTPAYSYEDALEWIRCCQNQLRGISPSEYAFVIMEIMTGKMLGGAGLNQFNPAHPIANLGYWVRASVEGKGIATRATSLLAKFGFEKLGLKRIEIVAAVENLASQRVALKAGAKQEASLRNRLQISDSMHDAILFSLIPGDI